MGPSRSVGLKYSHVLKYGIFLFLIVAVHAQAFDIDLSRRRKKTVEKAEGNVPSTVLPQKSTTDFFSTGESKQELVILNTDRGFVPSRISLKKGTRYTLHIVNVNQTEKNISFILDAFSEHHSTFYGKISSFDVTPAQEGVFSFQCPETSVEGKLIVISNEAPSRGLATEGD